MNYFKILGIVFGTVAMLKPFYMHILPWDENKFIAKAYSRKRPFWVLSVGVAGLLLVLLTWYLHFTENIPYSLILTLLFSLTAIKALLFIFDYRKFQNRVEKMLKKDNGRDIVLVDIMAGIFGMVVIILSLIFY